jgi:predicted transcriptional regulator
LCSVVLDRVHVAWEDTGMAKSTTMTVRLPAAVSTKLGALARDLKRTKSFLAGEAIASFVERNAWQVEEIKASLKEAGSGAPAVPHRDVEKWVRSWGTQRPLRRPRPKS